MCSNICRWHLHLTEHLNSKHVIFSMRWQVFWRETCLNLALQSEHVNSKEPRLVTFIYNKSGSVALFLTGLSAHYLHTIYILSTNYLRSIYTLSTQYQLITSCTLSTHYLHTMYRHSTHYLHTIYTLSTDLAHEPALVDHICPKEQRVGLCVTGLDLLQRAQTRHLKKYIFKNNFM